MTVGDRIRNARKSVGVTQQELANRLGISYVGISQWENNSRNPKIETIRRIAKALGVPMAYLMGDTDNPVDRSKTHWMEAVPPENEKKPSADGKGLTIKEYGPTENGGFRFVMGQDDSDNWETLSNKAREKLRNSSATRALLHSLVDMSEEEIETYNAFVQKMRNGK